MFTERFNKLSKNDIAIAGGKGASLGEMAQAKFPVPPGFVVLASAFERFLAETDLSVEVNAILKRVNYKDINSVDRASNQIRDLIADAKFPVDIGEEIVKGYRELFKIKLPHLNPPLAKGRGKFSPTLLLQRRGCLVAVRSSATAEDSLVASWAGELESYLNVDEEGLLEAVKKCWSSLFTPRAIFYRFEKKLSDQKVLVAVVVQAMVQSEISGIAFTAHPVTEDRNQMVIEAGYGLGEAIVGGLVTPDTYVIDKAALRLATLAQGVKKAILDKNISEQTMMIVQQGSGTTKVGVDKEKQGRQKLADSKIIELAKICQKIENHYNFPQDIEWALEKGKFYITQSRPITTLSANENEIEKITEEKLVLGNQEVDASLLNVEMTWAGMRDNFVSQQIGKGMPIFSFEMVKGRTLNGYLNPTDLRNFAALCAKSLIENYRLLDLIKKESIKTAKEIRGYAIKNKSEEKLSKLPNLKLADLLIEIRKRQSECSKFGIIVAFADIFGDITQKTIGILSSKKLSRYQHVYSKVLTSPEHKSLAEEAIEKIILSKRSAKYLCDKYFWLNQGYIGRGITVEEINHLRLEGYKKESLPSREILIKELKLSQKEIRIFKVVKELVFIKSIRADSRQYLQVVANRIVDILASRFKIKTIYLEALTAIEIADFIFSKQEKILDSAYQRFAHSIITPINEDNYKILLGKAADEFMEKNVVKKELINITEIKGQIAYSGKVTGRVKLVFGPQHIIKVQTGDILVSIATSPQLLPAMNKAAAFIADLGGITSHAAIVARELKKPCLVGVKGVTQALKDGDLVEVDANKGVVKILKRA